MGAWTRQGVTGTEWAALIAVVAGLALFMLVASPSERSSGSADPGDWIVTGLSIGAAVALLVWYGLRTTDRWRAAALGLAAGLSDAFMAVMTKAFAHVTDHGAVSALTSWAPVRPVRRRPDRHAPDPDGLPDRAAEGVAADHHRRRPAGQLRDRGGPLRRGAPVHGGAGADSCVLAIAIMATGLIVLSRSSVASRGPRTGRQSLTAPAIPPARVVFSADGPPGRPGAHRPGPGVRATSPSVR